MSKKKTLILILAVVFTLFASFGSMSTPIAFAADPAPRIPSYELVVKDLATGRVTNYQMSRVLTVTLYAEYKLSDNGGELVVPAKSEITVKDNGTAVAGSPVILEKGNYTIRYSPDRLYASTGTHIDAVRVQNKNLKVFVFASYNKYSKEKEVDGVIPNQMKYNATRLEYDEYVLEHIEVDFNDEDFYLSVEDGTVVTTVKDGGSKFLFEGKGIYTIRYAPDLPLDNADKVRIEFESEIPVPETIEIYNVKEFNDFALKTRVEAYSREKTVLLQANLDFLNTEFIPVGHFNGTFKGNGNTIKNVVVSGNGSYSGIFRYVGVTGVVKDLIVEANIELKESQNFLGGIVGSNSGLIENCIFQGNIKGNNSIGGIVGVNEIIEESATKITYGIIKNCENRGDIRGYGNIGGIAGLNNGEIYNSTNNGKINAVDYLPSEESKLLSIGGIVGFDRGNMVSGCVNNGAVGFSKIGSFVGGIVGMGVGVVTECANNGAVVGNSNIGGIIGYNASFMSKEDQKYITDQLAKLLELNFGIDIGTPNPDDGTPPPTPELLLKATDSTIKYSYNRGDVIGETNVGGVMGYMNSGKNLTTAIYSCFNKGIVTANKDTGGGVVGNHLSGNLSSCFNIGEVKSKNGSYIGGIAGVSNAEIKSCYAICDLIGKSYVGGIVGKGTNVTSCYSNATIISNGEFRGAIAGTLTSRATFNYYIYSSVDGIDNISYVRQATRLTVDELASKDKLSQKLTGFESADWVPGYGKPHYPILRGFDECDQHCVNANLIKALKDEAMLSTLQTFKILFVDGDGNHIYSEKIGYNQSLADWSEPEVPKKEGYYGEWDKYTTKDVTKDQRVNPIYVKQITSVSSDSGLTPTMFLNGVLHPETILTVEELPFDSKLVLDGKQLLNKYKAKATLRDKELNLKDCTFKVYVPSSIAKPQIAKMLGGGIEYIDGEMQGNYLKFNAEGVSEFMVVYNRPILSRENAIIIGASAAAGAALTCILILTVRSIKKKIRRKKAKKEADEALKVAEQPMDEALSTAEQPMDEAVTTAEQPMDENSNKTDE